MKATVIKKYDLFDDEVQALEKTLEILNALCEGGFEDEFSCSENVYLGDTICTIESIIDNDGADWE